MIMSLSDLRAMAEAEALRLYRSGLTAKQIAPRINRSVATVRRFIGEEHREDRARRNERILALWRAGEPPGAIANSVGAEAHIVYSVVRKARDTDPTVPFRREPS